MENFFHVKSNLKTSKLSDDVQLVICIMLQSFFYLDCGVWAFSELESFLCLRKTVYLILHTGMDGEVGIATNAIFSVINFNRKIQYQFTFWEIDMLVAPGQPDQKCRYVVVSDIFTRMFPTLLVRLWFCCVMARA